MSCILLGQAEENQNGMQVYTSVIWGRTGRQYITEAESLALEADKPGEQISYIPDLWIFFF